MIFVIQLVQQFDACLIISVSTRRSDIISRSVQWAKMNYAHTPSNGIRALDVLVCAARLMTREENFASHSQTGFAIYYGIHQQPAFQGISKLDLFENPHLAYENSS